MASIDRFLNKSYISISRENAEEYLKAIGLPTALQKLVMSTKPVIKLTKSGDEYTFASKTSLSNTVVRFKPGQEFDKDIFGHKIKSVVTIHECTLIDVLTDSSGRVTTQEWTFSDDEVKEVIKFNDGIATVMYKAQ